MDAYIRVSRVAGREGERFISPADQRKKIKTWAQLHDVEIIEWWEEVDQSGAKLERPLFQEALGRCERGETEGIVVAKLDRFARSAVDALTAIKRLNEAGARLASVEDGFDGSNPMGRFAIGILLLIAELELERISGSWKTAVSEAIERGVYISAIPPTGYLRNEEGRLEIDPVAGPLVAEAFRRRGEGASWAELVRFFNESGISTSRGNPVWTHQTVAHIIRNPAYLGQARQGAVVNEQAHPPLVTPSEWQAAQSARGVRAARDGSLAAHCLLGGLLVCGGCGHKLKIGGSSTIVNGERAALYSCRKRYATGICPAPAAARAKTLDAYVEAVFLEELRTDQGIVARAVAAQDEIEQVLASIDEIEHELVTYLANTKLLTIIGEARWNEGAAKIQERLDRARRRLGELQAQHASLEGLTSGDLLVSWQLLSTQEKRRVLSGFVDRIVVRREEKRTGRFNPGRVDVAWRTS
jgi:site-specific DNA recombinase